MNLYEHTIVAKQDITASQIKQLTEKYTKIVINNEGEILQTQNWGLLNLTYIIKNNKVITQPMHFNKWYFQNFSL